MRTSASAHEDEIVAGGEPGGPQRPAVEIVIPVHNEEHVLEASVLKLHDHLTREFSFSFQITVADNASADRTLEVARRLARELPDVEALHLDRKGRGRALRAAWGRSRADVVAYMDVDLSTDLSALAGLLLPLLQRRGDIAIGSRLAPGAVVSRGIRRELISRSYNLLLHALLGTGFSDAQCGFKAGRREVIQALLDDVEDESWFFDTELLYLAQRRKFAIREVPVRWVEDRDSRVDIIATAREDLRGIVRLRNAEVPTVASRRANPLARRPGGRRRRPAGPSGRRIPGQPV
ncbi:MAG TPA: dolichyl-phosphate beta-glucosyltransferase [Solirubrobacteraceae bacterium]|jgi:glycosyltransferase involved in cell wall biosynthesis|nr:dolichyl-phosphate beta-glucosyltransferase [Solirubrobacteraceae bacterium]